MTLHVESQWSNIEILGDLKHIGQPFVLGTVAIGKLNLVTKLEIVFLIKKLCTKPNDLFWNFVILVFLLNSEKLPYFNFH